MTQPSKSKLLPILWPIIIAVVTAISTFAVTNYRVNEQATQIKSLQESTVKKEQYDDLQKRLDRIEGKIESIDEHIIEHMEQSINRKR